MAGSGWGRRTILAGFALVIGAIAGAGGTGALAAAEARRPAALADGGNDCTCSDFVTGGGWITGTPTGARGNFGVGGGLKDGALWGHLLYIDHDSKIRVKGTEVTGYEVVDDETRRISGNCTINGQGGHTYVVEVADHEDAVPGYTFSISLDTDYSAKGELGGGYIAIHEQKH